MIPCRFEVRLYVDPFTPEPTQAAEAAIINQRSMSARVGKLSSGTVTMRLCKTWQQARLVQMMDGKQINVGC